MAGFALAIITLGIGLLVATEAMRTAGWLLTALGLLLLGFSLRPTVQSLQGQTKSVVEGPRVALHGGQPFHIKRVPWQSSGGDQWETYVLGVRLSSSPQTNLRTAVAEGLKVELTCEGRDVRLPWIRARLDYSAQPGERAPSQRPQHRFDLGIGDWVEANLVIKEHDEDSCYLFNNDSYAFRHAQNPAWKLGPGEYKITLRVEGVAVAEQFECVFFNGGKGHSLLLRDQSF